MNTCFVIQPFDQGKEFDKRYDDIFVPAIQKAGLESYRVDRDPQANILIDNIELGIKNSRLCLADISKDNPNVWFELGYALASNKEVILVCSEERDRFPFDVQHRKIITYKSESTRDFHTFENAITARIKILLTKEQKIEKLTSSPIKDTHGLSTHEITVLTCIMGSSQSPYDPVSSGTIKNDMERAGFTKLATNLAVSKLLEKEMVAHEMHRDNYGSSFSEYSLTPKGTKWLIDNENELVLKTTADDDIPF